MSPDFLAFWFILLASIVCYVVYVLHNNHFKKGKEMSTKVSINSICSFCISTLSIKQLDSAQVRSQTCCPTTSCSIDEVQMLIGSIAITDLQGYFLVSKYKDQYYLIDGRKRLLAAAILYSKWQLKQFENLRCQIIDIPQEVVEADFRDWLINQIRNR